MELNRREFISASGIAAALTILPMPSTQASIRKLKNGIDISWLPDVEKAGGKFFTSTGSVVDPIRLMKISGISLGRIRVWVNPAAGNGSISRAISLAKRLKQHGLEICLDFHFSDTWADPAHQSTPSTWPTQSLTQLKMQVSAYVDEALRQFNLAKVTPQWVQLGNEISSGFLWPLGKIDSNSPDQWTSFVAVHQAATKALRKAAPKSKSILHLDCGGDAGKLQWWLSKAKQFGLTDYDVLGLSYYSQWHGSLTDLKSAITTAINISSKPVVIAETAYPWTVRKFGSDVLDVEKSALENLPMTEKGQAEYVDRLQSLVRNLPNNSGLGIWWWEGLSYGVTAKNGTKIWGGGMENSALVSPSGKALAALKGLGK